MPRARLFVFFFCLLNASIATAEGRDDGEVLAFYKTVTQREIAARKTEHGADTHACGTYAIGTLKSLLDNRDLSASVRKIIGRATHPGSPDLPETKESRRFIIRYTVNNPAPVHNVTHALVDSLIPVMENAYAKHVKAFGDIQHTTGDKIVFEIYSFANLEPFLQNANGFTTYGETFIALSADHLRSASICSIEDTIAHELFHRVQYAHGLLATGIIEDPFFVEGMAEWGAFFINPKNGVLIDFIAGYFNDPAQKAFKERSYEVSNFWVYLDERFQEFAGRKASGRVIDSILNAYKKGKYKKPFFTILSKSVAALLAVEDEKFRTKPGYKTPPVNRFFQEWHLTNGLKDLNPRNKKLTYSSFTTTDTCGTKRELTATTVVGGTIINNDNTYYTLTRTVPAGGVNYYNFPVDARVKSIKIDVDSPDGKVTASVAGFKGNKQKILQESLDDSITFDLKFKPGAIDYLIVAVSAQPDKTSAGYTLKVNDKSLAGSWFDDSIYYGRVTIKKDKDNIIEARQAGIYQLTGTRDGDIITLRLTDTTPGFTYTGTYRFRLCPSGRYLVGSFKDDDDLRNGTNGTTSARWCRFDPKENHDESDCIPDVDPTCESVVRPEPRHP